MKKNVYKITIFLVISVLFVLSGCKKAEEENSGNNIVPQTSSYTLTVILSDGVEGDPGAGTYTYNAGDSVSYSFTAVDGYSRLKVELDGADMPLSGSFTMSANRTLAVSAGQIDIRGRWVGRVKWFEKESTFYPKEIVYFAVKFSGGILSGNARGLFDYRPDEWGQGPFNVKGDTLTFKLENWDDSYLYCTGTLLSDTKMEGSWYFWTPWGFFPEGTWELEFKPEGSGSASFNSLRLKEGKTNPFKGNN